MTYEILNFNYMSEENKNGGNDNQKVQKAYEKNLKKLVAIVGGEGNLRQVTTVKRDTLGEIVTELFKEETESVEKATKEALKTLLKNRIEMQRSLDAKKKELAQLETTKMKEFNEAAVKLFKQISGLDDLEKEYYGALTDAANATTDVEETQEDEDDE
jgi:hypothetical protein